MVGQLRYQREGGRASEAGCFSVWLVRRMGWLMGGAIAPSLLFTPTGWAQQALPPPPSIPNSLPSLAPVPAPGYPSGSIYRAPMPPVPGGTMGFPGTSPSYQMPSYQVIVNGDSPYLLQQIQLMEPAATVQDYQGRRVIQAGNFASETEAQQRVAALAQQGVAAQVMGMAGQAARLNQPGLADMPRAPFYQVVVPTQPEQFSTIANRMISMGVKPEAIQSKRVPLGPHLAVGPFTDHREAESVSQYLRSGGMEARVHYSK